ncbi:MAG: hypothetical protein DRP76_01385 [Candidatus Omnitrophota bacterium]|nr:MAG: hypothetical protein DRP76_01385 [Candidatus Omnitrophota bacterium]
MESFIIVVFILIIYVVIVHIRWRKKFNSYQQKIKEEEAQIIQLEKMASLGVLSAGIAHEINNPLTFMITNLNLLLQHIGNGKSEKGILKENIEICMEGANRIKRIIQDLLLFSHPAQGNRVLTDINTLMEATLRILWNEIKHKIDVVKDYKASASVDVDPNQVTQVFLNIIMNAAEVIEERGTIYISTYEDDENVFVRISDTGPGIPKKILSKIFEPFFTTKKGTGLGLYVSRNIVTNHGGKIEVESKEGEGTTFTISFPKDYKH